MKKVITESKPFKIHFEKKKINSQSINNDILLYKNRELETQWEINYKNLYPNLEINSEMNIDPDHTYNLEDCTNRE